MKVALLTPMKPPDASTPSGDRTFARLILKALATGGHTAALASPFVTRCNAPEDLAAIEAEAPRALAKTIETLSFKPDIVLTYHNYHKAPDLLGPRLAAHYGAAYAIVEASRSPRQATGPWAEGFARADAALAAANAVGAVTARDRPALADFVPHALVPFQPFIDTAPFAAPHTGSPGGRQIVSAAMMRPGRKADSVALLASAFCKVAGEMPEASLTIAGDGPERARLEPLFAPGTFVGRLAEADLAALFAGADLFVWPAIEEPFGFVFLEAQAAGLPVIGGAARGVVDIVRDGGVLVPPGKTDALAAAILALLSNPARLSATGKAARSFAAANDLGAGAARLDALFAHARRRHTAALRQ
ncbi:glycosyltransferase family 4 protein [Acuticoccus sp. MNP-M23]|uniref:glycosyltransferase family 4 protein n=1 Tax=Acuticoccus sp. MNP-M23 TaxID=3072793 RepID=UPI0028165489|nr:glycosyltransferase family 4 protein [Acuticoccus sp. MNP-M23]WMS40998.1 glycosyltransferase family 4 protein [Acuticoccus sp. MNP-M23]